MGRLYPLSLATEGNENAGISFVTGIGLATIIGLILGGETKIADSIRKSDLRKLKAKRDEIYKNNPWLNDTEKLENDLTQCRALCCLPRGGSVHVD